MKWSRLASGAGAPALARTLGGPVLGAVVVGAVVLATCSGRSGAPTEGTLKAVGSVFVDGKPVTSGSVVPLKTGNALAVLHGTAVVTLRYGGRVELRDGTSAAFNGGPQLITGDLLAESAGSGSPLRIGASIASVAVQGVARLHRDLALTVGTYQGEAVITAGRTVVLPALSQDTIASVSVAPQPSPLHLDATDNWDERFLGTAIAMTSELDSQSRYVTANVPAGAATSAFYGRGLRPLASLTAFDDRLLKSASPTGAFPAAGEGLTAAAIALSGPGNFAQRWQAIFALRAEGAQWGIIVQDEAANPGAVLGLVGSAVRNASWMSSAAPVAAVPATSPSTPSAPASHPPVLVASPPSRSKSSHPSTPAAAPTAPTAPTQTGAMPSLSPSTTTLLGPVLDPVVNPLGQLLRGLLGLQQAN